MRILWLAKRHYTQKDALAERFGRVYELPSHWAEIGVDACLELLDYRGGPPCILDDGRLRVASTPVMSLPGMLRLRRRVAAFRPDAIVASGDCFVGLLAWRLARKLGARFVFDVYDDYRTFAGYRAFLGWDAYGFLMRRAHRVFYASRALADTHAWAAPWHLVPNGVDPAVFRPGDRASARARCGLADAGHRWVGYFGSMEPERGPADLIVAVGTLHGRDPAIRLVLCGTAPPGLDVAAPWVEYHGNVDHARIPDYINACDVVALPYRRGPTIDMASSVKIAEYLFCERPVVSTATPNLLSNFAREARELGEAVCRPGDPADLARAIGYQLEHCRVVVRPERHTWSAIAQDAWRAIEAVSAANRA